MRARSRRFRSAQTGVCLETLRFDVGVARIALRASLLVVALVDGSVFVLDVSAAPTRLCARIAPSAQRGASARLVTSLCVANDDDDKSLRIFVGFVDGSIDRFDLATRRQQ